jgi:hypothetical protein
VSKRRLLEVIRSAADASKEEGFQIMSSLALGMVAKTGGR